MKIEYKINSEFIREAKLEKGVTISQIAKYLEITNGQVYKLISGDRTLSLITAKQLSDLLDISIVDMLIEK
jgi:predicted transcriptional regulator